ncbi:neuronal PAS domain-containing protein 1 isoform X3 [Sciurus carolinensis]|uniref:neuronal PAS domain-containing protein 1 isoform X3 n=1 Tax=Sciurus carolinensis TaxID=30640 RepID=UPI001FB540C8|nr:neuronal PAS domain-containing protein 1 isoform X3 [Sciurus carolinensis]
MTAPYPSSGGGSEVKCGGGRGASVPWDFLPGLMVKAPPGPCLQAQRKEKSRNAARSRRGKENLEFFELAKLLPLPGAISSQLDKASIVRLSVTYLRLRRFAALGAPPWGLRAVGPPAGLASGRRGPAALVSEVFEQHLGGHILQSLDGFVFALNQEGKFLYISETVSIYLGLSQVELTGSSVFDYIHPGDHSEVLEQLGLRAPTPGPPTPPSVSSSSSSSSSSSLADTPEIETSPAEVPASPRVQERSFFIRMKSTLTKRGLHVKASGYKSQRPYGPGTLRACGPQLLPVCPWTGCNQDPPKPPGPAGQGSGDDRLLPLAAACWGLCVAAVCGHCGWQREEPWGASCAMGQPCAQLPASVPCEDTSSPRPEHTEREPPVERKQAVPAAKDEAPKTRGKRIKVEPAPRENQGREDSGDEEPSDRPAPPRREFTSVIRAGALKQDPVRPWGLAPPGDPPASLLHAGFLPPVVRSLCAPGAIRYGPAELGLVYPHLPRLGPGPALPEAFYPSLGLPYPGPPGTRVPRKGD